jgi:hypothetical protein
MSNSQPEVAKDLKKFADMQVTNGNSVKTTGKRQDFLGKIFLDPWLVNVDENTF